MAGLDHGRVVVVCVASLRFKVPGRSTSGEEMRGGEKLKNGEKWKNACINKLQPREMERERRVSIDQLPGFLSQGIGMDQFERGCFS